jgi:cobalt-precorrin 5A hydrolase
LVVGIGLHWDTSMETIESGIKAVFENFGLDIKCIRNIASIDKEKRIITYSCAKPIRYRKKI